jgi:hypothetical protein
MNDNKKMFAKEGLLIPQRSASNSHHHHHQHQQQLELSASSLQTQQVLVQNTIPLPTLHK